MHKVLITCPPMILRINECKQELEEFDITIPTFNQTMSEEDLVEIIDLYDAWIAGDDPVSRKVLEKGKKLKVVIKWGIGTDNIDFKAIKDLKIPFSNTPGMFGNEVADVAIGYLISLTRNLFNIDKEVRKGNWIKPSGISLAGKKVALIGFGDIGRNIARRLLSLRMKVFVSDPGFGQDSKGVIKCNYNNDIIVDKNLYDVKIVDLNDCLDKSKVVILSCPSTEKTYHIINKNTISMLDNESYIINVSRGALVKEEDIINCLGAGKLVGFASDVFENEPIKLDNKLLNFDNVIVGSHNASNTIDAVDRTNKKVIDLLKRYL